jgi:disulfide bond formation protein DsbB
MKLLRYWQANPYAWLAALCTGLVCGSFFVQHVLEVEPCPLCILQRLTYATLAVIFLVAALCGDRPVVRRSLHVVATLLVLAGGGIAAYQSQLQIFPPAQAAACSASLSYMVDTLPAQEVVGRIFAAHGDCSDTSFKVAGLTLAQISLGVFACLGAWLLLALRRRPVAAGAR